MRKPIIKQAIFTVIVCLFMALTVLLIVRRQNKKIAVVDAVQLFNHYKMKQELEEQAGTQLNVLNKQIDSLKHVYSVEQKSFSLDNKRQEVIYNAIQERQLRFEELFRQSNQSINEQVWKRLNPLIDEYGKQHRLRVIIGANGMGSILYYDGFYDKTQELIDFINKKYEEGD